MHRFGITSTTSYKIVSISSKIKDRIAENTLLHKINDDKSIAKTQFYIADNTARREARFFLKPLYFPLLFLSFADVMLISAIYVYYR